MSARTIVCLSSQGWDDGMWTNKQHIMSRLARDHRVIYVEYGLNPLALHLFKRMRHSPRILGSPTNFFSAAVPRQDGLVTFDCATPLPAGLFPMGTPVRDGATYDLKVLAVRRFLAREKIEDAILWVYHPGYGDAVERIPHSLLIYDCVDNYAAFPAYRDDSDWLMEREERLCRKADLVTCTAPALYEAKKGYNPDNTYLVHNVGDAEHFKRAMDEQTPVADELRALDGPIIGFVGAVSDYKLNTDWLLHLARERPDWQIVVVGPVGAADPGTSVADLEQQSNVHLLGHRPYERLPEYLKGFDVAAIPYRINEYTRSVFPIKFFEFLASGRPVVISDLPALEQYWDAVHVATSADEFVQRCEQALAEPEAARAARVELAEQNSWSKRIGSIMDKIEERLPA